MSKSTGLYPQIGVDTAGAGVVSHAGAVLLLDTIRAAGLDRELSKSLGPWRKPTAVYDPSKILLDVAVSLAVGGDCLADIAALREAPQVFRPVASDPTVSRLVDTLACDAEKALAAIEGARAAARKTVWQRAGTHAPDHRADHRAPLVVDIDATLVTAHSDKEHAAPTFKRGFGHHPLTVKRPRCGGGSDPTGRWGSCRHRGSTAMRCASGRGGWSGRPASGSRGCRSTRPASGSARSWGSSPTRCAAGASRPTSTTAWPRG